MYVKKISTNLNLKYYRENAVFYDRNTHLVPLYNCIYSFWVLYSNFRSFLAKSNKMHNI